MNAFSEIVDKGFEFLKQTAGNLPLVGSVATSILFSHFELNPTEACQSLVSGFDFSGLNTTILSSKYYQNVSEIGTLNAFKPDADAGSGVCRVQFVVNTSATSAVKAEAWLPTDWNRRSLTLGNGGLGGIIDYDNLGYGASLGFASIASNNGHDGNTGKFFTNPEVLADFTTRSIHVSTVAGSKIAEAYYEQKVRRAYYLGCSTGGRQGIYSAVHFPGDFDGILAGAPATNFNFLLGWTGMVTLHLGAPHPESSPAFISKDLWKTINAEVLRQCDGLDGVKDGIITEPDACEFGPEELLCKNGRSASDCLSIEQVEALRKIYSPLYGPNGEFLFPGFTLGAELSWLHDAVFSGKPFAYTEDLLKYVVYNDTNYDFTNYSLVDVMRMQEIDPGEISTFSGDLAVFRARGGKLISYHGRKDDVIPSANAKTHYNKVARTLGLRSSSIDDFYRLFLIPGMEHCWGGPGAVRFGQTGREIPIPVNASAGRKPDNILLALVDWVERGHAPATITGQSEDGKSTRVHCRYPQRSVWDGTEYICVS